jgi:dolichyl-phosphate beta-glucosyltransferase
MDGSSTVYLVALEPQPPSSVIALVVPVWKDSARLAVFGPKLARELAARSLPVRWIIADDGSGPDERRHLEALCAELAIIYPAVEVHGADRHRGKGAVVREAWALAPDAEWLAFADADGSVAAGEMLDLIERAVADRLSTFAVRVNTATTRVESGIRRELLHHAYLLVARLVLGLRSADLQCGAKVLAGDAYRKVAHLLREEGWAFDSELLSALRRHGFDWQEIPVNWTAQGGGKVRPIRDGLRMIAALHRIRARWRNT